MLLGLLDVINRVVGVSVGQLDSASKTERPPPPNPIEQNRFGILLEGTEIGANEE